MTYRGATSLMVAVVALSSAAWGLYTSAQASVVPVPWVSMVPTLLPSVVAVGAAILVLRASAWWCRAGLSFVVAFAALETLGLFQVVPFASQFAAGVVWWDVATAVLALATAVLAAAVLRDPSVEDDDPPGPARWLAVGAGLLLVASTTFAWAVSSGAPAGRWTVTLGQGSAAVLVGTLAGMLVVAGITAAVAISASRPVVVGATAALFVSRPLAAGVFEDVSWREADAVLAAGWWFVLVAQVLLVVALAGLLGRRTAGAARVGQFASTNT